MCGIKPYSTNARPEKIVIKLQKSRRRMASDSESPLATG